MYGKGAADRAKTPYLSLIHIFFKLANIIPADDAVKYMKEAATATYGKKGETVVKMNHDAIDAGAKNIVEVKYPASVSYTHLDVYKRQATA